MKSERAGPGGEGGGVLTSKCACTFTASSGEAKCAYATTGAGAPFCCGAKWTCEAAAVIGVLKNIHTPKKL